MKYNHNDSISYSHKGRNYMRRGNQKFSQKEVSFDDFPLYFPKGLEKLFLFIYIVTLPYLAGMIFLFFYVAEAKGSLFSAMAKDTSFIFTWLLGYEIMAILTLLYIMKMAISFTAKNNQNEERKFRRP